MASIIKDKSVDTLRIRQALIHPVVRQDTDSPIKGKFIYNAATNVPSFADGAEWHDLATAEEVMNVSDASVVLTEASTAFPNGRVITAGDNIDVDNTTPGVTTISFTGLTMVTKDALAGTLTQGFTIPAGAIDARMYATGGGGGGGGPDPGANNSGAGGGGSGAGLIFLLSPGDVITYALGTGGAGGAAGAPGADGTATLVGVNSVPSPSLGGGQGGSAAGTSTGGGGGTVALTTGWANPSGYFGGSSGGDGGALGNAGSVGGATSMRKRGGFAGSSGASGGGGGGGGGSVLGIGGNGAPSGTGAGGPGGDGAGGGGSSGVGPSGGSGGDGGDGNVVVTYWI